MRTACVLALQAAAVLGCTEVTILSPSGEHVIANSVEASNVVRPALSPVLRGEKKGGRRSCMSFEVKYGYLGTMNEQGLALNGHTLDLAVLQQPQDGTPTLCQEDFEAWALGTCATVAEVIAGLKAVRLVGGGGSQWGVHDAGGDAAVIEYVKGELRAHNNSRVGVMTNDPTWDWHLQNVNNYVALQPGWYGEQNERIRIAVPDEEWYPWATNAYDAKPPSIPSPIGHAYNQLGLPGDGSPPSRFIRAFFMRQYAILNAPPKTLNDTLILAQELLNAVYKPLGTVAARGAELLETTPLSTLMVPELRTVYTRSREDMTWRMVDLSRIDFTPSAPKRSVNVAPKVFGAVDMTDEFL